VDGDLFKELMTNDTIEMEPMDETEQLPAQEFPPKTGPDVVGEPAQEPETSADDQPPEGV
jgi:hypothetical protein